MSTEHTKTMAIGRAVPVGFIPFRQHHLLVVYDTLDSLRLNYIQAKPTIEAAGLCWEAAQQALERADCKRLYERRELLPPEITAFTASGQSGQTPQLYLRLDDTLPFLTGLSMEPVPGTDRRRMNGLDSLALQADWAQAVGGYNAPGRVMKLWQRYGLEELISSGAKRNSTDPMAKMLALLQKLALIYQLSEHGQPPKPAQPCACCCHRPRSPHSHG